MGRRRLPALLALLAGLLLGVGAGAQGVVAFGAHTSPTSLTAPAHAGARVLAARVGWDHGETLAPTTPRPPTSAFVRAGHGGQLGGSLRELAVLTACSLLAVALVAFLVRQRRRSRPPGWHRSTLFARGPPLLPAR